jgi:polyisoprenoid-binding protein YceI
MMLRINFGLLSALLLGLAVHALAQEQVFHLDPAHSRVEWTLPDGLHTVKGTFKLKDSTLDLDPVSGKASGALVVDATSGDSGSEARDHKMNKDILESSKYPEFRFTVQGIKGTLPADGSADVQLSGVMTLHGGSHPMTVTAPVKVSHGQASADVHFLVPYVQWGLKDPSTFILRVGKEVDIVVHAVGSLGPAPKS